MQRIDRELVVYMAREAGLDGELIDRWDHELELLCRLIAQATFTDAIQAAIAKEREGCALTCEKAGMAGYGTLAAAHEIRQRGKHGSR